MSFGKMLLAATAAFGFATAAANAEDWNGFYAGVLGGGSFGAIEGECCFGVLGASKVFGYNWDNGDTVMGIDEMVTFTNLDGDAKISWQKSFRFGWEVTDNTLLYGGAGAGVSFIPSESYSTGYGLVATGLEVAMTEQLAIRAHAQMSFPFDPEWWDAGLSPVVSLGTGFVWSFN